MASAIIVFDYIEPRIKLMSWFLRDSGLANERVTSLEEARHALNTRPRVLVINSSAENAAMAALIAQIRAEEGGDLRIVVLHDRKHRETEDPIDADVCVHGVGNIDDVVEVVRAVLEKEVPDIEPHAAGRELTER